MTSHYKILSIFLSLIVLLLMMSSCGHNADNSHLALVDSLLAQDKSDEALQVLQAINTSTYSNSDKAYHALLTTQAQQECHIIAASDSAINMAVKYYQAHNDKERLARALLYQGCVNKDLGQLDKAITSLRQAEDVAANDDLKNRAMAKMMIG